MLEISEALRTEVARFVPTALLQECLLCPTGSWQGFEHLTVAVARFGNETQTRTPTQEEAKELMLKADQEFAQGTVGLPPVQHVLLNARALRPRWLSAPIYARILRPFDDICTRETGVGIAELFSELAQARPGPSPSDSTVAKLLTGSARDWRELTNHQKAFECPAIDIGDGKILLAGQKVADFVYRELCASFREADSHYSDKKGDALEKVVQETLERFGPHWRWYSQYHHSKGERDHLGLHPEAAIVAETKSVTIRSSSVVTNAEHLKRDLRDLAKGHAQVTDMLQLVQEGGSVDTADGPLEVPPTALRLGLLVTDEPSTAYVRTIVGEYLPGAWTGDGPHMLSVVDLDMLCRWAGTPAVLMDYVATLRSFANMRWNDEPECMLAYGTEPALNMARSGVNVDLRGFDWDRIEREGIEAVRPPWLTRLETVRHEERQGRMRFAMRLLDQDKRTMSRWANRGKSKDGPSGIAPPAND